MAFGFRHATLLPGISFITTDRESSFITCTFAMVGSEREEVTKQQITAFKSVSCVLVGNLGGWGVFSGPCGRA